MTSKEIGFWGERTAAEYLCKKGMTLLEKNYSVRGGEIDLIMSDGGCTVFVEVKTRAENAYGTPLEYIDDRKRRRIIKTAVAYLNTDDADMRFDAIEIVYRDNFGKFEVILINHIENAFGEGY